MSDVPPTNAIEAVLAAFPWMAQLGLVEKLHEWAIEGLNADALVGRVRQTEEYKFRFPGIRRGDGSLRMNEAQYLARAEEYRELLRQYGRPDYAYDNPADLAGFFEQDISPDELRERFQIWEAVRKGSDDIKDAFYVFAGMTLDDERLYQAVVDPGSASALVEEYNQRIAQGDLDYETWVTRATEAGLSRVARRLADLQERGVVTGDAVASVAQIDSAFAKQMMDVLYHGGQPGERFLNLQELMNAFEYAMIGSAATQSGFKLPDKDRVVAIRQAGVDRAKALEAYSSFGVEQGRLRGAVQRANRATTFTQDDFERAVLLQQADAVQLLQQAQGAEEALRRRSGSFAFDMGRDGSLVQRGLQSSRQGQ